MVRLSPDGVRALPYALDPAVRPGGAGGRRAPRTSTGWVTVTLPVESEEVAHTQLAALGPEVEVLAPESLRARFAGDAERLARLGRAVRDITIRRTPRAPHPRRADAGPVMDETEFWELVDGTREAAEGDPEEQADLLVDRLLQLDPELVLDFARHFEARYNRAYTWDLWGAAWILLDGASDDAFDFFRCWLIGQGREVYEGAVHDPDSLADLLDDFDEETRRRRRGARLLGGRGLRTAHRHGRPRSGHRPRPLGAAGHPARPGERVGAGGTVPEGLGTVQGLSRSAAVTWEFALHRRSAHRWTDRQKPYGRGAFPFFRALEVG